MLRGVNFFGPYEADDSIGRVASLNIACLAAAQVPHEIHLLRRPAPRQVVDYGTIDDRLLASLKYKINLFHFNARRVPLYFSRLGDRSLDGFYNIGFWVHEMPSIPNQWARQLEFFREIWVPSSLCQGAVGMSANIPVVRIPYPIETADLSVRIRERAAGREFSGFNFLTIFDVYSDAERKNPLFTLKAFLEAHGDNPSVRLIVKTRNLDHDPLLAGKIRGLATAHESIELIDGFMSQEALLRLYDRADAYVSLHRAEGFGLTISDAMSRGIPIVATGYSGNMDFCNSADSRLVAYKLREVGHDRPRYRRTDVWAEPDLDDAIQALRDVVEAAALWRGRALAARARVAREFSIERVAALMRRRLELIEGGFEFTDDMSDRRIDVEVGIVDTYGF